MSSDAAAPTPRQSQTFLGHPVGLYVLFFTEMWERFSYYGMRALLMLYMVNHFRWTQEDASTVYKWYTSLVYLTPILGGYLADRYLGNRRAVIIGAVLMAIGHFLMAFEAMPAFFSALVFLILGNGFFKPNMSTQVGRLYPVNDDRRDGAYTIFYMGINLGAFLSPLVCGWLAEHTRWGYHAGFAAAGIGMVVGLLVYLIGLRWVVELDQKDKPEAFLTGAADERLPAGFVAALRELQARSAQAGGPAAVQVQVKEMPAGFDVVRAGFRTGEIHYDPATQMLTTTVPLTDEQVNALMHAGLPGGGDRYGSVQAPGGTAAAAINEEVAEQTPSSVPILNRIMPLALLVLGGFLAVTAPILGFSGLVKWDNVIALEIASVCAMIASWILSNVHNAVRDRVLAIYALALFVVFFWAGFEQAGNVLNLWADQSTDRYLTQAGVPPPLFPGADEGGVRGEGLAAMLNPVPTAWFQSINALAIFLLAPLFAWMWTALGKRGLNPSIPLKMGIGVLLLSLAFALMIGAARSENQPSSEPLAGLPATMPLSEKHQLSQAGEGGKAAKPFHAGRLTYDRATKTLHLSGVLPLVERDRIVAQTAPVAFVKEIEELQKKAREARGKDAWVSVTLDQEPPGFDMRYTGFDKAQVKYDPATRTLSTKRELAGKDMLVLKVAAGDREFRHAINGLVTASSRHRVSSWWLFWAYILMTLGELCLSPVGLSMVSKLAPAKFATMLMGLWLLTSFFGHFVAGSFGEQWGTLDPSEYFVIFMVLIGAASLVLFALVRKIVAMMHGVK